jgi:hypothetical protein
VAKAVTAAVAHRALLISEADLSILHLVVGAKGAIALTATVPLVVIRLLNLQRSQMESSIRRLQLAQRNWVA